MGDGKGGGRGGGNVVRAQTRSGANVVRRRKPFLRPCSHFAMFHVPEAAHGDVDAKQLAQE